MQRKKEMIIQLIKIIIHLHLLFESNLELVWPVSRRQNLSLFTDSRKPKVGKIYTETGQNI